MPKIRLWAKGSHSDTLAFFCHGCSGEHVVSSSVHSFNGNFEKPTLSPSVLCTGFIEHPDYEYGKEIHCHSFVTDGMIKFEKDSRHALAGEVVLLPDVKKKDFE